MLLCAVLEAKDRLLRALMASTEKGISASVGASVDVTEGVGLEGRIKNNGVVKALTKRDILDSSVVALIVCLSLVLETLEELLV